MGGAVSAGVDNDDLVDNLKAANYITTPLLERVFRAVDRGNYFTAENREQAYRDNAWKKGNLHLSAPCIYAKVMEGLQLAPGHSFLNLGSGTGYLSTMAGLIIGPYGINHGVELHADVVKYGLERLEEFKRVSPAIDAFTFCDPQFVQGNCLCLPPDMRLYDRVYCGASCPETHEQYMKALIKPGGVLVMPINDQLVKMTRNGSNTWETVSLLPVSFSSLVMPDPNHPPATVSLPGVELPDLQDMCRQELRSLLRANVEHEHPDLVTAANRPVHKLSRPRDRRQIRRIVVPYVPVPFYESDDDPQMISDDDNEDRDDRDTLNDAQRHTANQISAFIELARNLAGQRRIERDREDIETRQNQREERDADIDGLEEDREEGNNDDAHNSTNDSDIEENHDDETEPKEPLKRTDFLKDKEVNKDVEEVLAETSRNGEEPAPSVSTLPHSDPIPMTSTPVMPVKSNKKREKFDSGVGDEIENGKGPSSESDQGDDGDIDMDIDSTDSDYSDHSALRKKVSRLLDADDPNCPCGGNCSETFKTRRGDGDEAEGNEEEEGDSPKRVSAAETYSTHMREKISLLPLPHALKLYLNYNREL
ncbi:protein-L-isoaspartate O-methyltransferase domain-containing protein 1-like [Homarus americanus]|uniref:L-isoaspartate O-methyltransferase domain-containing protein 1-like n=1 Tax=Homarus americanus TaxID=6706 RepID=A0A8J5N944_HOMAM|nr:protein-L-isoaspartate O-methyltransferase domain-containing protein 1-like [Homarus americanus]KAG7176271.1 L-isoaspartate O-methyltransferase domain-containing protein 1-like [Homarus americanus]